ncbi:MAG: outer membrane protein assembly factor BamA [Desulfuromonadales bacterium]
MIRFAVLVFFGVFLLPGLLQAQTYTIDDIAIEGTRRVEPAAVRAILSVRPGEKVAAADIDRDLRTIFRLGRFSDVTAELEERNGKTVLIYRLEERPLVRQIEFADNEELSEEKLRDLLTIKIPEIYNPQKTQQSVQAIRNAYVEEGYYAAAIEPQVVINEQNEATVTFRIQEGEKVYIRNIKFEGNEVFTDKELRKFMETKERWMFSWLTGRGAFNEQILENDLEIIADQYYDQGYVQVKVRQPRIDLGEDKETMDILIEIDEGRQFRVGELNVQGDLVVDSEEILALVKLAPSEVFSRRLLRESVLAVNGLYANQGYAYVNVSPLTRIEPEKRVVNLVLDIEKGVQVSIDRIRITGNTKTRDKVIRREMEIAEGALYNADQLAESRRKINNLGFFDEVNIATSRANADKMDIEVAVKERPTGTFSVGVGYSSVDGVIGQGSITQENFLGRALKLNLAASLGSSSTTFQVGVTDPWFLDRDFALGFDIYKTDREWLDFSKKTSGGDLKLGFPVAQNTRAFFIYRYEEKEIYDVETTSNFIRQQEGESTLSSITGSLTRNTTDYRLDPSSGSVASASVELAGLGGTQKFAKYTLDYRYFFPLKWSTVFSAHGHLGFIQGLAGEEIPIDERFFLGGLSTMRGFESRTVGPRIRVAERDGSGNISSQDYEYIGGNKAAYFNFEYLFPLLKEMNLKGVIFFDVGNAWRENEDYFDDMRYAAGAGIRWFSPMGPLRLEWGYNLDPRDDEPNTNFEFSIGSFF